QAHARVWIGCLPGGVECRLDHRLGALEVAHVGERVAEVGAEADACSAVLRWQLVEAVLEELDRAPRLADGRVRATERRVDVGSGRRRDELRCSRRLELAGRARMV